MWEILLSGRHHTKNVWCRHTRPDLRWDLPDYDGMGLNSEENFEFTICQQRRSEGQPVFARHMK